MTLNFSFSFLSLWSSFFSCLKPPYIILVVNVLIITIIALSKCYPSISDLDHGPDENALNCWYETPLVYGGSGRQKQGTPKGKDKKALRVVDPKEGTLMTSNYQRSDKVVLGPGNGVKLDLRKSETSRADVTNNYHRMKNGSHEKKDLEFDAFLKKMEKRMRHLEQDREFDEFIKKTKTRMRHEEQDLEFDEFIKKTKNRMRYEDGRT